MKETMSLLHSEVVEKSNQQGLSGLVLVFMLLVGTCCVMARGTPVSVYRFRCDPETVPRLAEAIDPLEYLGLNGASMEVVWFLVILAGILGSHRNSSLIACEPVYWPVITA